MARGQRRNKHRVVLVAVLVLLFFLSLLFYTILTTQPKNLQLGVVSLDQGYISDKEGPSNLGQEMVDKLASGEFVEAASGARGLDLNSYTVEFKTYDTKEALDSALNNDEVAGAIVIPEDYTKTTIEEATSTVKDTVTTTVTETTSSIANTVANTINNASSSLGSTTSSSVDVLVQNTADPMVANQIGSAVSDLLDSVGVDSTAMLASPATSSADTPDGKGNLARDIDPLQHIWLLLPPVLAAIVLARFLPIRRGDDFGERIKRLSVSVLISGVVALAVAAAEYALLAYACSFEGSVIGSVAHLWLMSFLVMLFFDGLAQLSPWAAGIVAGILVLFGAIAPLLPVDSFPAAIIPWLSSTFTDASLESANIAVVGPGSWNAGEQALLMYALAGVLVGIGIAAFGPRIPRSKD